MLVLSWVLLATGGYFGKSLYEDYLALREENSYLLHKERELEALRQTMERIRKDENTIRSFLGVEKSGEETSGLGQGGEPSPDLSTIALNDAMASGSVPFPAKPKEVSILQRAKSLELDLQELVETMRSQRETWDSTPSIMPVNVTDYWFSSGFGWRRSPFTGLKEFHNGLDISSAKGTPIVAPADGTVIKRGYDKYLGKFLKIDHGRKIVTTYGHLSAYNVSPGQKVERGDIIASMGNTGLSTGHHLHYMIKVKDRCVNPLHYILNAKANRLLVRPLQIEGGGQ
ncbi:MAG: peptidoglycan DD-metalloendopeptidase family protein [Syntrophobacterales bacterium]|jgi:murein DD-endopeptidase MepM/ murein hydrolase activator NlpD